MKASPVIHRLLALAAACGRSLRRVFKRVTSPGSGPFFAGC
jgi:hypothetical protein